LEQLLGLVGAARVGKNLQRGGLAARRLDDANPCELPRNVRVES
jgi:hypothetical protein